MCFWLALPDANKHKHLSLQSREIMECLPSILREQLAGTLLYAGVFSKVLIHIHDSST